MISRCIRNISFNLSKTIDFTRISQLNSKYNREIRSLLSNKFQQPYFGASFLIKSTFLFSTSNFNELNEYDAVQFDSLAENYVKNQDFHNALENYVKSLNILIKLSNNARNLAKAYQNISFVYLQMSDYKNALQNIEKALQIQLTEFGETHGDTAKSYYLKSQILMNLSKIEEAFECGKKALFLQKLFFNEKHIECAKSYINIGKIYLLKGDLINSKKNFENGIKILNELKEFYDLIKEYTSIGKIYEEKGDFNKCLENYLKARDL